MKRILLAAAVLAVLVPISLAQAEPVQEFSFQLTGVKPDGRFTVVFTSRTYDTSGGIPPVVQQNYLRIPAGARLNKVFLKSKYYCDGQKLLSTLNENPNNKVFFFKRVENLNPLIKTLKNSPLKSDRKLLKNVQTCKRAMVGRGTVEVDARPLYDPLIPAKIYMFFSKGQNGAVGAFSILGMPDESSPVVKALGDTVRNTRVVVSASFFNDPTPDGKYGYRLQLPAGPIVANGVRINISIAEVNVTTKGLTLTKKKTTCLKRRHGKCVKKKVKKSNIFWFTRPTCPPSGTLTFLAFYGYNPPQPNITKTVDLPCPKFSA